MSRRILVVADDPYVLDGLHAPVDARQAWDLAFVASGAEALQEMAFRRYDVIAAGIRTPAGGGGSLLIEVQGRHPEVARIVLARRPEERDIATVVGVAHQFLRVPVGPGEAVAAAERAAELRDELGGELLPAEVTGMGSLPSPPSVFLELVEVLESGRADAAAIARVVERDVALSAKLLRLVNSAFFALRSPIGSVEAAVVRLGSQAIRSLMFMGELHSSFGIDEGVLAPGWLESLNERSLAVGRLAQKLGSGPIAGQAFATGLLLECGQLVFASLRPHLYGALLRRRSELRSLLDLEREAFGVTHAQVGAYLLGHWGFPAETIEAVALHGRPVGDLGHPPLDLTATVEVAHRLVDPGLPPVCDPAGGLELDDERLAYLGLLDQVRTWRESLGQPSGVSPAGR
ncbi:MAG TPA: response regulator [Acidimicrobiales bacterium]|nr:response regulator [Acidimicrobiales bacterium]